MFNHICFDKDGTLTDVHSYWAHTCALRSEWILRRWPNAGLSKEIVLDAFGICNGKIKASGPVGYKPRPLIIEAISQLVTSQINTDSRTEVEEIFKEVDIYQQNSNDYRIDLLPGVIEFLEGAKKHGLSLTVFTSDRTVNTKRIFDSLGISHYFASIVGGDRVTLSKPNPEGLYIACREATCEPSKTIYISDTAEDMQMAISGGSLPVGITTGLDSQNKLLQYSEVVFEQLDFNELLSLL